MKDKNLRDFCGTPLWRRALNQATRTCDFAVVSSNIPAVYNSSSEEGVTFDHRPEDLSSDTTSMDSVIKHLILKHSLQDSVIVLLQPTSPLRTDEIIETCKDLFIDSDNDLVITVSQTSNSVMKYGTLSDGNIFQPLSKAEDCFKNRQVLPSIYKPTGAVYVFSAEGFLEHDGFPHTNIAAIVCDKENSIDVDNLEQFELAENLAMSCLGQ